MCFLQHFQLLLSAITVADQQRHCALKVELKDPGRWCKTSSRFSSGCCFLSWSGPVQSDQGRPLLCSTAHHTVALVECDDLVWTKTCIQRPSTHSVCNESGSLGGVWPEGVVRQIHHPINICEFQPDPAQKSINRGRFPGSTGTNLCAY